MVEPRFQGYPNSNVSLGAGEKHLSRTGSVEWGEAMKCGRKVLPRILGSNGGESWKFAHLRMTSVGRGDFCHEYRSLASLAGRYPDRQYLVSNLHLFQVWLQVA